MKFFRIFSLCLVFFLISVAFTGIAQSQRSRKPEIIRDTDTAEGKENSNAAAKKEPNPMLAEKNINIGNFYFKRKNYAAAIERYLEAIEYQPNSIPAYEALARAYEKNGEFTKAIETYKNFIDKYPNSPKSPEFRTKLAEIEKKAD
jgi:outer membrane protein assembly factor BamD (BamD/ComL family)